METSLQKRYSDWINKIANYLKNQRSGNKITQAMGQYLTEIGNIITLSELQNGKIKDEELGHLIADLQNLTEILIQYVGVHPSLKDQFERLEIHTQIARPTVLESGEVLEK